MSRARPAHCDRSGHRIASLCGIVPWCDTACDDSGRRNWRAGRRRYILHRLSCVATAEERGRHEIPEPHEMPENDTSGEAKRGTGNWRGSESPTLSVAAVTASVGPRLPHLSSICQRIDVMSFESFAIQRNAGAEGCPQAITTYPIISIAALPDGTPSSPASDRGPSLNPTIVRASDQTADRCGDGVCLA